MGLWKNSGPRARVDYWLVVPQQTNLELHNRHGNVSVGDLRGQRRSATGMALSFSMQLMAI